MLILNVISLVNYILYNEIILNNKDEIIEIYENNKEVNEYMGYYSKISNKGIKNIK